MRGGNEVRREGEEKGEKALIWENLRIITGHFKKKYSYIKILEILKNRLNNCFLILS